MSSTHAEALSELRLQLLSNGYEPIPIARHDASGASPGKRPTLPAWRTVEITPDAIRDWQSSLASSHNTGIRTGRLVGVDFDVLDRGLAAELDELAASMLGTTPLVRIGKDPKALWCFRADEPFSKIETPELILPDGTKAQIEILADGQQFVSHGIHPDTRRPYRWVQGAPENTRLGDLPTITRESAEAFVKAAEGILREAGGRTEREINPPQKPERPKSEGVKTEAKAGGDFFRQVNNAALADIGPWLRQIFPGAEWLTNSARPPGMWRVSSKDIGRDLEEDLSVHPELGAQDFGTRESLTPIDIMMRHGGAPDAKSAAFAICDALRIDPASLGWGQKKERQPQPDIEAEAQKIPVREEDDTLKVGRLVIHRVKDAAAAPVRPYIIKGLFYEGEFSAIYGPPGCGKSFMGAHLGYAAAQGRRVLDKRVKQVVVLYAFLEGEGGATKRIQALEREFGDCESFRYIAQPVNLHDDKEAMIELIAAAKKINARWIIIDTLNRAMGSGDENSPEGMGKILSVFSEIRHATGAHVTVVHHTGKDVTRGMRGHNSLHGACDCELEISRTELGPRLLRVAKAKDDADGQKLGFDLRNVVLGIDEDGDRITTCLVAEADEAPADAAKPLPAQAQAALRILQDTLADSGHPSPLNSRDVPSGVRICSEKIWRQNVYDRLCPGDSQDTAQTAFRRARKALQDAGRIAQWRDMVWLAK